MEWIRLRFLIYLLLLYGAAEAYTTSSFIDGRQDFGVFQLFGRANVTCPVDPCSDSSSFVRLTHPPPPPISFLPSENYLHLLI